MSEIKVNSIKGVGASTAAITVDNTSGSATANLTTVNSVTMPNGGFLSNRNLMINGAMQVAQRGTSSTTATAGYHTVDRFRYAIGGHDEAATHAQVDVASGTSPYQSGFRKAYKITNGNQTSGAGSDDYIQIDYYVEAQDIANSGWDVTNSSSNLTFSFWIKSSVSQFFTFAIRCKDGTEQVINFKTPVLSADTWTKVTKTIPGNSNLTVNNDNGQGLQIMFFPFIGTDYSTVGLAEDTWSAWASAKHAVPNTSTWWTTNDATWEITGIQLEVGATASDFAHEDYATTLTRCQRYFYTAMNANGAGEYMSWGIYLGSGKMMSVFYMPVPMRANPTVSFPTGTNYYGIYRADGNDQFDSLGSILGPSKFAGNYFVNIEILSGVSSTGGYSGTISAANNAVYVHFSAEL